METTATYDVDSKEFILNSPTDTSMKFWVGSLGKTANMAVVLAKLIINEIEYGVHAFVISIRDKKTHLPHPGIRVGECGPKRAFDGMDTGYIKFDQFRVPKDSLLDRFCKVADDGTYTSPIKDNNKRFVSSIACLTSGRIFISRCSADHTLIALTIALRYSVIRKQFGPINQEKRLITYPLHQYRLFPKLAIGICYYISTLSLYNLWLKNLPTMFEEGNKTTQLLHSLSSLLKAFGTWNSSETTDECRQACGSNGYLLLALYGKIEEIDDVNRTWEGDNNVLLLQVQAFLLRALRMKMKEETLPQTLEFLTTEMPEVAPFEGDINNPNDIMKLFDDRANYMVHKCAMKFMADPSKIAQVLNENQPFDLRDMCAAYLDVYNSSQYVEFISNFKEGKAKEVISKLFLLYLQYTVFTQKHYYTKIFSRAQRNMLQESIMSICESLVPESILLTDCFPYPNLNYGGLGNEDLRVWDRLVSFQLF